MTVLHFTWYEEYKCSEVVLRTKDVETDEFSILKFLTILI